MGKLISSPREWLRILSVPCFFVGVLLILIFLHAQNVYAAYIHSGVLEALPFFLLFRYIFVEFMACSALVLILWRPSFMSRALAGIMVVLFMTIQFIQYRSRISSDGFITAQILQMAHIYQYSVTWQVVLTAFVTLLVFCLTFYGLLRSFRVSEMTLPSRLAGLLLVSLFMAVGLVIPHGFREQFVARRHGLLAQSPTIALARACFAYSKSGTLEPVHLSNKDLDLARSYGIDIDPDRLTPVFRPAFFSNPLPFPRNKIEDADPPNIIVLFIESLSAVLLEPYDGPVSGLTPHILEMSRRSMRVDEYFNHTTPTIKGIRGQLCSMFPVYTHKEWKASSSKLRTSRVLCLPHILADDGYQTIHLTHAERGDAHIQAQLVDFGYQEMYFSNTILDALLDGEPFAHEAQSRWFPAEPSDLQMFRSLIAYLERRETGQPFFISLSTIGTHTNFDVRGHDAIVFEDGSNPLLNTFHNLDHAYGVFWDWFKGSPYYQNTLVVLTGDHVLYPHDTLRRVVGTQNPSHNLDRMALIIYDPTHELPQAFAARTSSLDLAPSLLQLLHIASRPNPFLGLSMFSDRQEFHGGPGESDSGDILSWEDGQPDVTNTDISCSDARSEGHPCALRRVVAYLQWLDRTNRIWREP